MIIRKISLQWFRGAAEFAELETAGKSVVVYGPNGAGKTTFVDSAEYLIAGGRIDHLSHEYGRQFPSIINTHAPAGVDKRTSLTLGDGARVEAAFNGNGTSRIDGGASISGWDKGRTILRQDEVSAFIHSSKGEKYSALLPLIGLGPIEYAAANLRALPKRIRDESGVERQKGQLQQLQTNWDAAFPGLDRKAVGDLVKAIFSKYTPDKPLPATLSDTLKAAHAAITLKIQGLSAQHSRHLNLKTIDDLGLDALIVEVSAASEKAAALAEPLLEERLVILRSAGQFGVHQQSGQEFPCPACGQAVMADDFNAHVAAESKKLEEAREAFDARRAAYGRLADALSVLASVMSKPEMGNWMAEPEQGGVRDAILLMLRIDLPTIRDGLPSADFQKIVDALGILLGHIRPAIQNPPPEVADLISDQKAIEAAGSLGAIRNLVAQIESVERLLEFIAESERQVREEIKDRTDRVIRDISADMQRMWAILHPDEPIDEVHLYQPDDADKAIDIGLRFYGKTQPSPRLTLSEGHRNSLGLCVFFALAKRHGQGFPLILDDIVTSFDREHRTFVADLLTKEFADSQILLFTHDYDWYVELRRRLPGQSWAFKSLLPWSDPATGIRWDNAPFGFGSARVLLTSDTMLAANKARAVMDVEMAVVAETLQVPVPHVRGVRNDMRGALDLLNRFHGRAGKCLKKRDGQGNHPAWPVPPQLAKDAADWLVTHGNAGSHGRYLTKQEAERLIDACEAFLAALQCASCKTNIWHARAGDDSHWRCDCDEIRWIL